MGASVSLAVRTDDKAAVQVHVELRLAIRRVDGRRGRTAGDTDDGSPPNGRGVPACCDSSSNEAPELPGIAHRLGAMTASGKMARSIPYAPDPTRIRRESNRTQPARRLRGTANSKSGRG